MKTATYYCSLDAAKRLYAPGPGAHWFDADTLRFFGSKLSRSAIASEHGIVFVESARVAWKGERQYRAVAVTGPGKVITGEFCPTRALAWKQAQQFTKTGMIETP